MVVFRIDDFDVILEMYWLFDNYVTVNYQEKQIVLNLLEMESVVCFWGCGENKDLHNISLGSIEFVT